MNFYNVFVFAILAIFGLFSATVSAGTSAVEDLVRTKRGHSHGHGHGPGKGGGAAGPVYFCGYVGKTEGYGGYGR